MTTLTELVCILDCSSSTAGQVPEWLERYNALLEQLRHRYQEYRVTTVLFDADIRIVHDREPVDRLPALMLESLPSGSGSAVLDAVGMMISRMDALQRYTPPQQAGAVQVVIATDGLDNASRTFGRSRVRQLLEQQQCQGWALEFWNAGLDDICTTTSYVTRPERISG